MFLFMYVLFIVVRPIVKTFGQRFSGVISEAYILSYKLLFEFNYGERFFCMSLLVFRTIDSGNGPRFAIGFQLGYHH